LDFLTKVELEKLSDSGIISVEKTAGGRNVYSNVSLDKRVVNILCSAFPTNSELGV